MGRVYNYVVTPLNFQIVMEDVEDPLASTNERPGAAEPNHVPQKVPLSPPAPTVSPAASSQEQNDKSSTCGAEEEEEMEMMDQDELEFLEGNVQLGILRSELNDVRQSLARRKTGGQYIPLKLYRSTKNNSISVTDVQTGLWCEIQAEYRYLHPFMKQTNEWKKMEVKGRAVQLKTPEMRQGTDIHLAKELEVHEIVRVVTKTPEDRWVVTLLDTYNQLSTVATGSLEREINVFGELFNQGILLKGIIDQVQYSKETGELTILDFKTRRTNTMPSEAQKRGHALQLMLYKCMLDSLTCGITKMSLLAEHLNLNFKRELTEGALEHISRYGMQTLFTQSKATKNIGDNSSIGEGSGGFRVTLGEVAEKISELIIGLNLPLVSSLMVQYVYQQTHEDIGMEVIEYDEDWARKAYENSLDFWLGNREPRGVDLEDLWKCDSCQFKDVCVWRRQKTLEQSPVATRPGQIKF